MPKFQIEAGGKRYEIEAPSREAALGALQGGPQQAPAQPAATDQSWTGGVLPFSGDRPGDWRFDSNAGLMGDVKRAFATTGGVARGEIPAMVPDTGQGVTNPQVETAAKTLGAMALPMSPAAGTGKAITSIAAMRRGERAVPTREQLHRAGSEGFNTAKSMGVEYDPAVISKFAAYARSKLQGKFNAISAKNTFKVLRDMEKPGPTIYNTVDGLHTAQQALRNGTSTSDNAAGEYIVKALQRFMEDPPAQAVLAGPAREAGQMLGTAKGNWSALERSKEVAGKEKRATLRAWASGSGLNMDNALRQRVADLLLDRKAIRGFSKEEVASLEAFVKGSKPRNLSRRVANILGGGGGLGTLLTGSIAGGAAAGGYPAALALPAVGFGAKLTQNALGKRAMGKVDEAIRMRNPLYGTQAMGPPAPIPPGMTSQAMQRAMMMGLYPPPQGGGGW